QPLRLKLKAWTQGVFHLDSHSSMVALSGAWRRPCRSHVFCYCGSRITGCEVVLESTPPALDHLNVEGELLPTGGGTLDARHLDFTSNDRHSWGDLRLHRIRRG